MNFELDKVFQHLVAHSAHADLNRSPGTARPELPAGLTTTVRATAVRTFGAIVLLLRELSHAVLRLPLDPHRRSGRQSLSL